MRDYKPRIPEMRSNLGVRNPYPLAEAILRRRGKIEGHIDWRELPLPMVKDYLFQAFRKPPEELFDPQFNSPLYKGMPKRGMPGGITPRSERELLLSRRVGAGASPCTAAIKDWIRKDGWTYPPTSPAPPPPAAGWPYGLDLVQGCAPDCYIIAALISVGWVNPAAFTGGNDPGVPGNNLYTFYSGPPNSGPPSYPSAAKPLPVDSGGSLIFARPTDNKTVWPSLYEKAYGKFRGLGDKPDLGQIGFWNALDALWEVTGKKVDVRFVKSYPCVTPGCTPTPTNKFDLKALFRDINAKGATGSSTSGKTKRPMVAWTFEKGTLTPYGDAYTDDLIVGNHAYSLLGTTTIASGTCAGSCVILRNPWGFNKIPSSVKGICSYKPGWSNTMFQMSQGNFAMTMDAFTHYFEAFTFTTVDI
jgi:hypothetical protein